MQIPNRQFATRIDTKGVKCFAGSQALVAYSLQKSLSDSQFSMVAEEDSADLRYGIVFFQHTSCL